MIALISSDEQSTIVYSYVIKHTTFFSFWFPIPWLPVDLLYSSILENSWFAGKIER